MIPTPRQQIEKWIQQETDKAYGPEYEDRKILMRHDLRQGALFGATLGFEAAREMVDDQNGYCTKDKYDTPANFLKELEK